MATATVKAANGNITELQGLSDVGVAGSFVLFKYEDGTLVLEKEGSIQSVEFTPTPTDSESPSEAQDNTPTE